MSKRRCTKRKLKEYARNHYHSKNGKEKKYHQHNYERLEEQAKKYKKREYRRNTYNNMSVEDKHKN